MKNLRFDTFVAGLKLIPRNAALGFGLIRCWSWSWCDRVGFSPRSLLQVSFFSHVIRCLTVTLLDSLVLAEFPGTYCLGLPKFSWCVWILLWALLFDIVCVLGLGFYCPFCKSKFSHFKMSQVMSQVTFMTVNFYQQVEFMFTPTSSATSPVYDVDCSYAA